MKHRILTVVVAVAGTSAVWLLVEPYAFYSPSVDGIGYYEAAEQLEGNEAWEQARDAWLMAKAHAAGISQSTAEASGRRAYCDYRIGMTYRAQGEYRQAAANLQLALATPASDIDRFVGRHGANEISRDLSDIQKLISRQP